LGGSGLKCYINVAQQKCTTINVMFKILDIGSLRSILFLTNLYLE